MAEGCITYTVGEAARILGVGESTMRRLIRQDRFPHAHFLGRILIPGWAPAEWLRQQALTTDPQTKPAPDAAAFDSPGTL